VKRYSEMTPEELQEEMKKLQEYGRQAFAEQRWSEYEVYMTKWYLAKSYLIRDTVDIEIGRTYRIAEENDKLTVRHLEGVMAWGIRESTSEEVAVPIAMLEDLTP
jgi:predicted anti-sigma-YlaC factor YlaD